MENSLKKKKKKKGFTLVELVIVLAVMGIIALIAIPSLMGTKAHFKVKADEKSCQTIERAINVLVVDETIPESTKGTIDVGFTSTDITATSTDTLITTEIKDAIKQVLTDIKKPQAEGKTGYLITLSLETKPQEVTNPDGTKGTKNVETKKVLVKVITK